MARAMDVAAWDVDFYALSNYKLLGPHMATLFVSDAAAADLVGAGGTARCACGVGLESCFRGVFCSGVVCKAGLRVRAVSC